MQGFVGGIDHVARLLESTLTVAPYPSKFSSHARAVIQKIRLALAGEAMP
jgi:hypothetical protein